MLQIRSLKKVKKEDNQIWCKKYKNS